MEIKNNKEKDMFDKMKKETNKFNKEFFDTNEKKMQYEFIKK